MSSIDLFAEAATVPLPEGGILLQIPFEVADAERLSHSLAKLLARDGLEHDPELLLAIHLVGRLQHALYREALRQKGHGAS